MLTESELKIIHKSNKITLLVAQYYFIDNLLIKGTFLDDQYKSIKDSDLLGINWKTMANKLGYKRDETKNHVIFHIFVNDQCNFFDNNGFELYSPLHRFHLHLIESYHRFRCFRLFERWSDIKTADLMLDINLSYHRIKSNVGLKD